jgi:hypothetical protein
MVLYTRQANPHVHISVRAEGRDGLRLNPRKEDLRRWREVFAERLRGWGIEAEASSQPVRGWRHRDERVWSRKKMRGKGIAAGDKHQPPHMPPSHRRAGEAWARIPQALAASPEPSDRDLSSAIVRYVRELPVVRAVMAWSIAQRELPGMTRSPGPRVTPTRTGPEMERYLPSKETTMDSQDTPDTTRGARDAARRVVAEHESIRLSRDEQVAFVRALLQPPEPNARLKRAAKAYLRRGGQLTGA